MTPPYATAIIPTHDRDSTLPFSLASVQRQSIRDIEIIVVLDGATRECRAIAEAAMNNDNRIRVMDLPKARGAGEQNVHEAVMSAQSSRIFYNDDDDLWLDRHIEVLGALLDDADIADTRVASANRVFELHLAPCPGANPTMRRLLGEHKHKTLFDTHIAHRRTAYDQFARWVPEEGESRWPVWAFLAGFANAPGCRWRSRADITAISVHGANRRDMAGVIRADEIAQWAKLIEKDPNLSSAIEQADSFYHFFRLVLDDGPGDATFETYLSEHGAFADVALTKPARDLFAAAQRRVIERMSAIRLARRLCAPNFVGYPIDAIEQLYLGCFGPEASEGLFAEASASPGPHKAGALAVYALLLARNAKHDLAAQAVDRAVALGPDPIGQLVDLKDRVAAASKSCSDR